MDHHDHVFLIRNGIPKPDGFSQPTGVSQPPGVPQPPGVSQPSGAPQPSGIWAEFGSGSGAFTLALAECLGPGGQIYSIDKDGQALRRQAQAVQARYPQVKLTTLQADFTRPLDLPALDGVLSANALHFLRDKTPTLRQIYSLLKPGGRLIVVEYNVDRGNLWVPHPFSYLTWEKMAPKAGFAHTELLATRPSSFLGAFYAALSLRSEED